MPTDLTSEMKLESTGLKCVELLAEKSVDSSQVCTTMTRSHEISYDSGRFTLLRSGEESSVDVRVIHDGKTGRYDINKLDQDSLSLACDSAVQMAEKAVSDKAHGFSETPISKSFKYGASEPHRELMYEKVDEFARKSQELYPNIRIRNISARHFNTCSQLVNSHDVNLVSDKSFYQFQVMCCGVREEQSSSMNYAVHEFTEFPQSLFEMDTFQRLLGQTNQLIDAKKIGRKFEGRVIISPKCLSSFLSMMLEHLFSNRIVAKTSRFYEKIGQKIVSEQLSISSLPQAFANPVYFTDDGFVTRDIEIVNNGVLNSYLLNLYGARKLGLSGPSNFGQRLIVKSGDQSLDDIVGSTPAGLLIDRFSGGAPNINGDFSGIAKNSFLIEDGQIKNALQETVISGNLFDMFNNIASISQESCNDGRSQFPWIAVDGILIS